MPTLGKKPSAAQPRAKKSGADAAKLRIPEPTTRTLRVYALDPSAGNLVGNVMSLNIRWERLKRGPVGRRFAVIDYDGANKRYYPPVDLDDYRILARDGLDPSQADPRFHQQMVYAVASQTVERFEAALGRTIHWKRAERRNGVRVDNAEDIWVLKLFPHAMVQANAFYSREAQGILFGYFRAGETNQGNNLPGQRVFTCLSHDIIAHEVTHAIIDGIRYCFTEPTNPDVLAFHEAFADITALFLHFSHKEALLDTIRKTGGHLYSFQLRPDSEAVQGSANPSAAPRTVADSPTRNPLIELAQQFGQASGMGRGLRSALEDKPDPEALRKHVNEPHFRGSILVAAVFDAYFTTYVRESADLFHIYRSGGAHTISQELPSSLARLLTEAASKTADRFFMLCARAIDYCPPVDITFGDFLRALITASLDLDADADRGVRQALMQAFRARGIYPESASFFSEDALCWPALPDRPGKGDLPALPDLVFGNPSGLTREEKDKNGDILRAYAWDNAELLGFATGPDVERPQAPSFHPVYRMCPDGRTRVDMVVELVQTRSVPFDPAVPTAGEFEMRGGTTLIIAAPERDANGHLMQPWVRYAIGKSLLGDEGAEREQRQRRYALGMGFFTGEGGKAKAVQADFALLHQGA